MPCPNNSNSNATGEASPAACICDPGYYAGPDGCLPCPLGTAKDAKGQDPCSPCARGTYAAEVGQTECDPCEPVIPARCLIKALVTCKPIRHCLLACKQIGHGCSLGPQANQTR
jgi:hypothetical protein